MEVKGMVIFLFLLSNVAVIKVLQTFNSHVTWVKVLQISDSHGGSQCTGTENGMRDMKVKMTFNTMP